MRLLLMCKRLVWLLPVIPTAFGCHFLCFITVGVKQIKITKMGELKFSMYFKWQIAVGIEYDGQIIIRVPFVTTHISLSKYAKGFEIFGWYR
jgi:hypothetical protein